jgi:hypothetical protein
MNTHAIPKSLAIHLSFLLLLMIAPELQRRWSKQATLFSFPVVEIIEDETPLPSNASPVKTSSQVAAPHGFKGLGHLLAAAKMGGIKPSRAAPGSASPNLSKLAQSAMNDLRNSNQAKQQLQQESTQGRMDKAVDLQNTQILEMPKSKLAQDDLPEVMRRLSQKGPAFRTCYEQALLIDSNLKGKVDFILSLGNGGTVQRVSITFSGQGDGGAQSRLRGCFEHVSRQIHFPASFAGEQLKTRLLLRS